MSNALVEEVAGAVHRVVHGECRAALAENGAKHAEEAFVPCAAALAGSEMKTQVAFLESLRTPAADVVVEVQLVVNSCSDIKIDVACVIYTIHAVTIDDNLDLS